MQLSAIRLHNMSFNLVGQTNAIICFITGSSSSHKWWKYQLPDDIINPLVTYSYSLPTFTQEIVQ